MMSIQVQGNLVVQDNVPTIDMKQTEDEQFYANSQHYVSTAPERKKTAC